MKTSTTKRDNFVRLAEKRTHVIKDAIRIFGNLSNRYLYEFTDEDVTAYLDDIRAALDSAEALFQTKGKRPEVRTRPEPEVQAKQPEPEPVAASQPNLVQPLPEPVPMAPTIVPYQMTDDTDAVIIPTFLKKDHEQRERFKENSD